MLQKLLKMRKELQLVKKSNKDYPLLNSLEMKKNYFTAKKLLKKTEKAIFKILENEK